MHLCNECRTERWPWKECPTKTELHSTKVEEWYEPAVICFCPTQTRWLICNLNDLQKGLWPKEPRDTGYIGGGRNAYPHHAYFETPGAVYAELDWRLEQCDQGKYKDGLLTRRVLADGWNAEDLAIMMNVRRTSVDRRTQRTVEYCSGWNRRVQTYEKFVKKIPEADNRHLSAIEN